MINPYKTLEVTAKFTSEEPMLLLRVDNKSITVHHDISHFIPELESLLQYLKSSQKSREQLLKDLGGY